MTPKPTINWGFITYRGFIRNASTKKLLALIDINGKEYLMTEGEAFDQVRLMKNLKDSVRVIYNGKSHFIPLNTKW